MLRDQTRCFFCDIRLDRWQTAEGPWVEHARHNPECKFLLDEKGQKFVDDIQAQYNPGGSKQNVSDQGAGAGKR